MRNIITKILLSVSLFSASSCEERESTDVVNISESESDSEKTAKVSDLRKTRSVEDSDFYSAFEIFCVKAEFLGEKINTGISYNDFSKNLDELDIEFRLLELKWPNEFALDSHNVFTATMQFWKFSRALWERKVMFEDEIQGAYLQTDFLEDKIGAYLNIENYPMILDVVTIQLESASSNLKYIPWSELNKTLTLGAILIESGKEKMEEAVLDQKSNASEPIN